MALMWSLIVEIKKRICNGRAECDKNDKTGSVLTDLS